MFFSRRISFLYKKYVQRYLSRLGTISQNAGWTATGVMLVAIISLFIIAINYNTYISVTNAVQNYKSLEQERDRLDNTKKEKASLDDDLAYYNSLEFKTRYGYDSLNLARPGEKIYVIDDPDALNKEENQRVVVVEKDETYYWWKVLWEIVTT